MTWILSWLIIITHNQTELNMAKHTQYATIEYLLDPVATNWGINKADDQAEYRQAKAEYKVRAGCKVLQALVIGMVFSIPLFIQIAKEWK